MNSKFLVGTSLLIALLIHLAIFSLTTFVFPIDPAVPKPKFFFLGPILGKNDVKRTSPRNNNPTPNSVFKNMRSTKNTLKSMGSEIADRTENPFAIGSIKKPLITQTNTSQKKIVIKSTFETLPEEEAVDETDIQQRLDLELKIQPYKPLQFRSH